MSASTGAARFGAAAAKRLPTPPQPVTGPQRKYTVLLGAGTADDLDTDLLALRRRTGRLVAKSDVIRELVALLHEDPALLEQVASRLADGVTA